MCSSLHDSVLLQKVPDGAGALSCLGGLSMAALVFSGMRNCRSSVWCLGFAGAMAVVATGVVAGAVGHSPGIRYLGANSIVVYLAFFLFMATTRAVLIKLCALAWC